MTPFADRKPIAPSLLSDPAFSANPYSHPFAVTNHETWLLSPPAGHPSLKKGKRTRNRILSSDSDSEPFPLIQPPNSPVGFGNTNDPPTTANHRDVSVPTKAKERHSQLVAPHPSAEHSHQLLSLSPQPPPASDPPKKGRTLMTFLKRRSSQQPESSSAVVNPNLKKPSTVTRAATVASDVIRPPAHRQQTEPNIHNVNKPVLPERPVTLGTSMPAATPVPSPLANGSSTAAKRRVTDTPVGRIQDLDRIDELDESNPWGVPLHHGGPYEAAVQAIRRNDKDVFAGYGSYHRGVPQSSDNNYAPPQAIGLSLNLLPGQILPRNIYAYNPPAPRPTAVMMKPPGASQTSFAPSTPSPLSGVRPNAQSSTSLPLSSRRQSYQPPPASVRDRQPRRQSYDPQASMPPQVNPPSLPPTTPANPLPPQPRISPTPQMSSPSSPQNQPISEPPSRKPLNWETEDHVTQPRPNMGSIGIGMAMFEEDSDEDSESRPSQLPTSCNVPASMTPETNDKQLRRPSPLEINQPEQASSSESVESRVVASTSATQESLPNIEPVKKPSAMQSPPPYTSPTSGTYSAEFQRSQFSIPSQSSKGLSPGSKSSSQTGSVSHMGLHVTVEAEVIQQTPISRPSYTPNPSNPGSDISPHMSHGPLPKSPESVQFEDTGSTHPSVSTRSSSQSRSSIGPPSSRHVPKRLVMPAPLAWHNVVPPSQQSRLPPPRAQMRPPRAPRPPPPVSFPAPVPSPEAMLPGQAMVKTQAKEIPFGGSRVSKLKKRVSLITATPMSTPSAPIVTTVSFAPPVIEFENSENKFHRVMTEKFMPRRVLSKHKTN